MTTPAFDRYRQDQLLGQGAGGTSFRAWDQRDQRWVALRLLGPEQLGPAQRRAALARALAGWRGLQHPGVLPVLDVAEEGGWLAIVTELQAAPPLNQLIFQQKLEAGSPAAWVASLRLLQVFHHSATRGLAHGGLKPSDLFVDPRVPAALKVGEFGLMAALQDRQPPWIDDLPLLANVLALLLTGQPLLHGAASGPAAPALARAAHPDPRERFGSVRDLLRALLEVAPEPLRSRLLSSLPRPTPPPDGEAPRPTPPPDGEAPRPTPPPDGEAPRPNPSPAPSPLSPPSQAPAPVPASPVAAPPSPAELAHDARPATGRIDEQRTATPPAPEPPTEPRAPFLEAAAAEPATEPVAPVRAPRGATAAEPAPAAEPATEPVAPFQNAPAAASAVATTVAPAELPTAPAAAFQDTLGAPPGEPATEPVAPYRDASAAAPAELPTASAAPFQDTLGAATPDGAAPAQAGVPAAAAAPSPELAVAAAEYSGAARPSRPMRRRVAPAESLRPQDLPESLQAALGSAAAAPHLALGDERRQEDPFAEPSPEAAPAVAASDWVSEALARPGTRRVSPPPASARAKKSPATGRARGRGPGGWLLVPLVLLLLLGVASGLAWLLRGDPAELDEEGRPSEQTEALTLRRVLGIGPAAPRPADQPAPQPAAQPAPADEAGAVQLGLAATLGAPLGQGGVEAEDPVARLAPMPSAGPAVVQVPGGPELPAAPFGGGGGGPDAYAAPPVQPLTAPAGALPYSPPRSAPPGAALPAPPAPRATAADLPPTPGGAVGGGAWAPEPAAPSAPAAAPPTANRRRAQTLNARGLKAYRAGQRDRALDLYLEAIEADPSYHWAHYNAACMFALQRNTDAALDALASFARTSPEPVDLRSLVYKDADFEPIISDPRLLDWLERQR